MSEKFLKRAVKKYFQGQGYKVIMKSVKLGNTQIDGEAISDKERIAIEIKSPSDDVARGLGQLAESASFGYTKMVLVTTLQTSRKIDLTVFRHYGWTLLGVDSKGEIHKIVEAKIVKF